MFTLTKEFKFEASHQLIGHDGKCARLHGHSWKARVIVAGPALIGHGPKEGMLADYSRIKELVEPLVEKYLDHHHLNETLECDRPTSEYVALWLYDQLKGKIGRHDSGDLVLCKLVAVEVDETCTSTARFEQ